MFQHLLVPLDGSDYSEQALPVAVALCEKFGGQITLMRVAVSPQTQVAEWTLGWPDSADLYLQLAHAAKMEATGYLEAVAETLADTSIPIAIEVENDHGISGAIVSAANKVGADAIVMSTHGRTGLQRWVLGSVADSVLRQVRLPVMLVRATEA